jgi:hypothetical protein
VSNATHIAIRELLIQAQIELQITKKMLLYKITNIVSQVSIAGFFGTSGIVMKHKNKANAPTALTEIFGIALRMTPNWQLCNKSVVQPGSRFGLYSRPSGLSMAIELTRR